MFLRRECASIRPYPQMSLRASRAQAAFAARDSDLSRAAHQSTELAEIAAGKSDFLHGTPPSSDFTEDPLLAAFVGTMVAILLGSCLSQLPPQFAYLFWFVGLVLCSSLLLIVVWSDERLRSDFGEFERQRERWEVDNFPEGEVQEMVQIYTEYGISERDAEIVAKTLSKYPEFWIDHMLLHEIGIVPNSMRPNHESRIDRLGLSLISLLASYVLPSVALIGTAKFLLCWLVAVLQGAALLYHKRHKSQWFSGTSMISMALVLVMTSGVLSSLTGLIVFII